MNFVFLLNTFSLKVNYNAAAHLKMGGNFNVRPHQNELFNFILINTGRHIHIKI